MFRNIHYPRRKKKQDFRTEDLKKITKQKKKHKNMPDHMKISVLFSHYINYFFVKLYVTFFVSVGEYSE